MSTQTHTPGPWVLHAVTMSADPDWHIVTTANRLRLIANIHAPADSPQDLANARLIAAAPELLEVVETLDDYMAQAGEPAEQSSLNPMRHLRWRAQQALAKATGTQQEAPMRNATDTANGAPA